MSYLLLEILNLLLCLKLGARFISYQMMFVNLNELGTQLKELLDLGMIWPNMPPWGKGWHSLFLH